jgi:hypothetical protein
VTTDRAAGYPRVLDELLPAAWHITEQYASATAAFKGSFVHTSACGRGEGDRI